MTGKQLSVLEICAGAGGQSLGLEAAGFTHAGAVEIDRTACATLRHNRPEWNVIEGDVRDVCGRDFRGIDLLAGGVPCPPFSVAGKQLGRDDERDLFPEALRLISEAKPAAVMLENVRGFATARFSDYRAHILAFLSKLGYSSQWRVLNASDYGVPQLRPRFVLVALRPRQAERFAWPESVQCTGTVGQAVGSLMSGRGWSGAPEWAIQASGIAPTIVGGSTRHGGPDLGPTRAKREWRRLGVDGMGIADQPPGPEAPVEGFFPRLTVRMVARLQGFPDSWEVTGGKTAAYRQVANAFPPPVAAAVGDGIGRALARERTVERRVGQLELAAV